MLFLGSCKKDSEPPINTQYTVYTSGFIWNGRNAPCYWKGTERTDLPGGISAFTTSIFVSQDTVYTAGYFINSLGKQAPCYWKGTKKIDLPCDSSQNAYTTSIYVSGGNVYTSGHFSADGKSIAGYWVNSDIYVLTDSDNGAFFSSIYIADGVIYLGGYLSGQMGSRIPCYWEDGSRNELPAGNSGNGEVKDICVSEGVVYTSGYSGVLGNNTPCYWAGQVKTDLESSLGMAVSISVDQGFVYTAGSLPSTGYNYFWKGISRTKLNGYDAVSVSSKGGYVFTAGGYYKPDPGDPMEKFHVPAYWIGTRRVDLPVIEPHSHNSTTDIFVE